jgi:putative lipoprotein
LPFDFLVIVFVGSVKTISQGKGVGMRNVIFFVLVLLLLATPAFALDGSLYAHFWTGSVCGLAADTVLYHYAKQMGPVERSLASTGVALVPGVINEIVDEYSNNHFGWDDVAADALGALTGVVAAELVNGQFWISASGRQVRLVGKW